MDRTFFLVGAVSAFLAVAAGAFGAHALRGRLDPAAMAVFDTAARYHMYHSLAILAAALVPARGGNAPARSGACLFAGGILLFSGSLYALALSGIRWFGAVTPIGGLMFLAGWALLAWSAVAASRR